MKKFIYIVLAAGLLTGLTSSCGADALDPSVVIDRDFELSPPESVDDLGAVLNGMYKRMSKAPYYGRDLIIYNEARTDNAYSTNRTGRFGNVSKFSLTSSHDYALDSWLQMYRVVSSANLAIGATIVGDQATVDHLKGQALAARALAHFDLLKLYGQQHVKGAGGVEAMGVPYVTVFAPRDIIYSDRPSFAAVRLLIYKDVDQALSLMNDNTSEYFKLNKQAVYGLKSRIALYFASFYPEDYKLAKEAAEAALAMRGSVVPKSGFVESYTAEGRAANAVFELVQLSNDNNGTTSLFQIYGNTSYGDVVALVDILALFQADDIRGSREMLGIKKFTSGENQGGVSEVRNIGKYNTFTSNIKVMRFEELLLNYAEAAYRINPSDAKVLELMNSLATARGLQPYSSISLENILDQRRKELMFEGFRFDDMMRLRLDVPKSPVLKASIKYGDAVTAFPIPLKEINASGMKQNENY